jgi:3-dehydroquinate dehydratase/shikimate dehydrogenase
MICISIAQESRRFALVDMHNAAKQCDLIELRLDRFEKSPDLAELLAHKPKPVIMSCRRFKDGGAWQGSEEERLTLLRQAIIAKADYVEIEHDVADQIRPFPPAKRVISYTNLQAVPDDIADIYADACRKNADVVKLTTLARTPEEAWPLVQIVARAGQPTVAVGLGKPGVTLAILGQKIGAPWAYAALERGMETYPGEPTVRDLEEVYHFRAINRHTRLVGVTGFGELESATVAALNAGLAHLGLPARCLPLPVGDAAMFHKVIKATKLASVVVDEANRRALAEVVAEREPAAERAGAVDLLLSKDQVWHGYNTLGRAALAALEACLAARHPGDKPLQGRMVVIVGANATARMMAYGVSKRGGVPIVVSHDRQAALEIAQAFGCRHAQFEALYSLVHDVLLVCADERDLVRHKGTGEAGGIHPGYLKPSITVLDLTALPRRSALSREAELRGCPVVSPRDVLLAQLELQLRLMSGHDVPRTVLDEALRRTGLGEE